MEKKDISDEMFEKIAKQIDEELNKPKFAYVGVMNFNGTLAYTLTKKVGGGE